MLEWGIRICYKPMRFTIKILAIVIVLGLVLFGRQFIAAKNYLLRQLNSSGNSELVRLRLENESLKLQAQSPISGRSVYSGVWEYKKAFVYSSYPFNDQRLLGINLGSDDGIKELMPVMASPGIIAGQVVEVFPKYSLVKTIFDPAFKIPVRVGWLGLEALLEGGSQPALTLIKKGQDLISNEPVYSAGMQFPYGMKIGDVGSKIQIQNEYFKKADVILPYTTGDLKEVFVMTNYVAR